MASKAKDNFHQGTITSPEEWVRRLDVLAGTSRLIPAIERGPNETRAYAKRREREAYCLAVMKPAWHIVLMLMHPAAHV